VGAIKQKDLTETAGTGSVYFPFIQTFSRDYYLVTRTNMQPELMAEPLRRIVRQVDSNIPLNNIKTMDTLVDDSLMTRRSPALLTGIFAAVALLLAAVGTYGVLSFAVSQRTREIGIRMALGALPQQVLSAFLGIGARLLMIGAVLGVAGALLAERAMKTVLYGMAGFPWELLAVTSVLMAIVVFLASYIPARRAARVDPMVALRCE